MTVVSASEKAPADAIPIALTVGAPDAKAVAQSCGIRVQNEQGRRTITVRGADASGVMYGGLDIAEAIRTGTLESLKDSDHTPHNRDLVNRDVPPPSELRLYEVASNKDL